MTSPVTIPDHRHGLRRGLAAQWTAANPVLDDGEEGYETDTGKRKVGDGTTAWNDLAYAASGAASTSFANDYVVATIDEMLALDIPAGEGAICRVANDDDGNPAIFFLPGGGDSSNLADWVESAYDAAGLATAAQTAAEAYTDAQIAGEVTRADAAYVARVDAVELPIQISDVTGLQAALDAAGSSAIPLNDVPDAGPSQELLLPDHGEASARYVLTQDCTVAVSGGSLSEECRLHLLVKQDDNGGHAITWTGVTWIDGPPPAINTGPNAATELFLWTVSGGAVIYGRMIQGVYSPATVPDAPTNVVATPGDGSASVTADPPASDGGLPISSYTATSTPDGLTASGPALPLTVDGLTNGVAYTFTVHATNPMGDSPESAPSAPVTPVHVDTVPDAPTGLTATPGDQQADASWQVPASDGGQPVTDYVIEISDDGGATWTTFADGVGTATSATVTGLTNGTTYLIQVAAVNSVGQSAFSQPASVTPASGVTKYSEDDFVGTPGDPLNGRVAPSGQTWVNDAPSIGAYAIGSDGASIVSTGLTSGTSIATVDDGHSDGMYQAAIVKATTGNGAGLVFRYQDVNNYWRFSKQSSTWRLQAVVAGAAQPAIDTGVGAADGDVLSVVCSGTSIIAKINGVEKASTSSSSMEAATGSGVCSFLSSSGAVFAGYSHTSVAA